MFPYQNAKCIFLIPIRAIYLAHLIVLHLMTEVIYDEEYKL
jgi:hypothetical protein